MLGIGVITTLYLASASIMEKRKLFFAFLSAMLLLIQFQQHARGVLGATIISTVFLIFLLYRKQARRLLGLMTLLTVVIALFTYHSERLQERLVEARNDIAMSKMGSHSTSLGYRFALWDIGLQGIAKRPLVGYGTGMAVSYFDKNIDTYKNGLYKNLRKLHSLPLHYHNDWIEIGMHLGILGVLVYGYFLRSWYQTLSRNQAGVLGAILLCFILLSGLTDVPVFLRQNIYLLVVITAVGVVSSKINGMESVTQKRIN
jgi:O-antigen ligase